MTIDEPTPFLRRLPRFRQPVNIDRSGAVRLVNRAHAAVLFGKVGKRQHLPARCCEGLAQGGFPRTGGTGYSKNA